MSNAPADDTRLTQIETDRALCYWLRTRGLADWQEANRSLPNFTRISTPEIRLKFFAEQNPARRRMDFLKGV